MELFVDAGPPPLPDNEEGEGDALCWTFDALEGLLEEEEGRFDGVLLGIVQQSGGIDGFFNAVFGFLRRKTDFFINQKGAEEIIVKASHTHYTKYQEQKKS